MNMGNTIAAPGANQSTGSSGSKTQLRGKNAKKRGKEISNAFFSDQQPGFVGDRVLYSR